MVIPHVVHNQDNFLRLSVYPQKFFEVFLKGLIVPLVGKTYGDLSVGNIQTPKRSLPFSLPLLANDHGLLPFYPPGIGKGCRVTQAKLVLKEENGVKRFFQEFFLTTR